MKRTRTKRPSARMLAAAGSSVGVGPVTERWSDPSTHDIRGDIRAALYRDDAPLLTYYDYPEPPPDVCDAMRRFMAENDRPPPGVAVFNSAAAAKAFFEQCGIESRTSRHGFEAFAGLEIVYDVTVPPGRPVIRSRREHSEKTQNPPKWLGVP